MNTQTMKNKRLLSLDVLRGITVAGMILVNNGWGESFEMLRHSAWNGLTPCDLVFPFFLYIVGISTCLSLSKYAFHPSGAVARKVLKRTVLLFLIGLSINWFDLAIGGNVLCFGHLRLWAVLQRIAVCYGLVSLFALTANHRHAVGTVVVLLAVYSLLLIVGNGYAQDGSNLAAVIDRTLFGEAHLYHKSPVDPEGLLGTISAVAHTLIGFCMGRQMKAAATVNQKIIGFFYVGTLLAVGGWLLSYGLPLNKRVWSPSFVLVTCGLASLLQGALMWIVDGKEGTAKDGRVLTFFRVFGVNPLALYASSEFLAIILGHVGVSEMVYAAIHALLPWAKWASLGYALYFVLLNFLLGYVLYKKRIFIKL